MFNEIIVEHLPKRYAHLGRRDLNTLNQIFLSLKGSL